MDVRELLGVLWSWTPYLAGGFAWNIIVSVAAMAVGTVLGVGLAFGRLGGLAWLSRSVTAGSHNLPTFVCLFYLAFLVPDEVSLGGLVVPMPAWVKAALALAVAVVGHVSDRLGLALAERRAGRPEAMLLFLPGWISFFLVIVMASSTASVIGVSEIVSRANTVIVATGRDDLMVWIYLYAMLWFLAFCWPLTLLMRGFQQRIRTRALLRPDPARVGGQGTLIGSASRR